MSYIANNLVQDDRVVYTTKFHRWMWLSNIFITIVLMTALGYFVLNSAKPSTQPNAKGTAYTLDVTSSLLLLPLGCLIGITGIGMTLADFISWKTSELGVTSQRIMVKRGLIRRRISEMNLGQFEAYQLLESLTGRLLGYKTIMLQGTGGTKYRYPLVSRANLLRDHIVELVSVNSRTQSSHYHQPAAYREPTRLQSTDDILPDLPPDEPTAKIREATELIKAGKRQEAAQIVKGLTQTYAQSADVWYLAGYLQSDPAKKRSAYERALSIKPNHKQSREALTNRG